MEAMLLQCNSRKHWRRINVDQAMFQPCMPAEVHSGEFVLRLCLLEAQFIHICSLIEAFIKTIKSIFSLLLFPAYWFDDQKLYTGPRCTVGSEFDSRSTDREFDPCPVPYFPGDCSMMILLLTLIQEGLLSATSESMCTN